MKMRALSGSVRKLPGLTSLLLVAVLAALAVYWGMSLVAPAVSIAPAGSLVSTSGNLNTASAATLFGHPSGEKIVAAAPLPRNIKVLGILASADRSAAIITVDGQSPAAFGVGQEIDEDLKITSVDRDEVVFELRGEPIRVPSPASNDASVLTSNADADSNNSLSATSKAGPATQPAAPPQRQTRSLNRPAPAMAPSSVARPGAQPPGAPVPNANQPAARAIPPGRPGSPRQWPQPTALGQRG